MIGGVLAEGEVLWILDRVPFRKTDEPMELGVRIGEWTQQWSPTQGHIASE